MTPRTYHAGKKAVWYCPGCQRIPWYPVPGGRFFDGLKPCRECCGWTANHTKWFKGAS